MLKIKDKTGQVIMELADDDSKPKDTIEVEPPKNEDEKGEDND